MRRSRRLNASLIGLAALMATAAACSGSGGRPIPPPPTTSVSVTSPPDPPNLSDVAVKVVSGKTKTTKVALTPGLATITGQVVGPDGPAAGATVRIERLVGEEVASMDIVTGVDGFWRAPPAPASAPSDPLAPPAQATTTTRPTAPQGILGGRYRVRAWRSPDLSLTAPTVLFLGGTEQKQLPLQVSRFTGLAVTSSIAPNPPIVGELANLAILVTTRSVDSAGIVRSLGVPAASVSLFVGIGWQIVKSVPETDGTGKALFQLRCQRDGTQPLSVNVNGTTVFTLAVGVCVPPPPAPTAPPDSGGGTGPTTSTTDQFGSSSTSSRDTTSTAVRRTTSTT